ncbi:hypothetical protein PIB30_037474 [Stylosanthes scabra]|uniref:Uncharacterized protein n=1 Tax=Stylosanthes scabra TaxID=79078 RepID=A0ABU6VCI7_9FABA|nr:hypothetical protein [Stylosanthes scabra]
MAEMGMIARFETSLQALRGSHTDITLEAQEIQGSLMTNNKSDPVQFADLKRRRYWFPLVVGIGLLVLQQLSGINGVLFYSSEIFSKAVENYPRDVIVAGSGYIHPATALPLVE